MSGMNNPDGLAAELEALAEKATKSPWLADLHHTVESAGRTYGWLRGDSIVPIAGVTLGVEGVPQDEGRANAELIALLRNNLPEILRALRTPVADDRSVERVANALRAIVSEEVIYLTGTEEDTDQEALFLPVSAIRETRAAIQAFVTTAGEGER